MLNLASLYLKDLFSAAGRNALLKGALGVSGLRVLALLLSFVTGILLARVLGKEGYGAYAYALAWIGLLVIPANLGLPTLLTREFAAAQARTDWGLMRGLLAWSQRMVVLTAIALSLMGSVVAWLVLDDALSLQTTWVALAALPLAALTQLKQGVLRGMGRVTQSQLPDSVVRPLLFIALVLLAFVTRGAGAVGVMVLYALTLAVAYGTSRLLLARHLPAPIRTAGARETPGIWLKSSFSFVLISSLYVVVAQTDTLMLGAMKGTGAAGIYVVANQGAQLVAFALVSVHIAVAPILAKLYAEGELVALQRLVTRYSRAVFALSLPVALVLIMFGEFFLGIFGAEFVAGKGPLIVLSLAHLLNAAMGLAPLLLSMTEHERTTALGIGVGAALNVVLNASLIPSYGIEGAALATAASFLVQNVLLVALARKRLGVTPTLF